MTVKKTKIRQSIRCSVCERKMSIGREVTVIMDYMEVPYLDKYLCSDRCKAICDNEAYTYPVLGDQSASS